MLKPGDEGYEDMIEFMRADLNSGMQYSKIEMAARKLIKERGGDFNEEFAKWKKTKSYGYCPYNYSGFDAIKSTCQECVEEVNTEDKGFDKEELHAKGTRPLVD